jgi:hypothetical protein
MKYPSAAPFGQITPPTRSSVTVWAEDLKAGRLPAISPVSGEPATASRRFKFKTAPSWTLLLIVGGILVGVGWIPGLVVRELVAKRASGSIHLTPPEIAGIRLKNIVVWGLLAATFGFFALSFAFYDNRAVPTGLLFFLALIAFTGFVVGLLFVLPRVQPRAKVIEPQPGSPLVVEMLDVHPSFAAAIALMYQQVGGHGTTARI